MQISVHWDIHCLYVKTMWVAGGAAEQLFIISKQEFSKKRSLLVHKRKRGSSGFSGGKEFWDK